MFESPGGIEKASSECLFQEGRKVYQNEMSRWQIQSKEKKILLNTVYV